MFRRALLLAALSTPLAAQDVDPGTSYLFRLDGPVPAALQSQLQQGFDVLGACCTQHAQTGDVHVVVWPQELAVFSQLAPQAHLVERGRPFAAVRAELAAMAGPDGPFGDQNYWTVAEIWQEMDNLVAGYPGLAQKIDLSALPGGSLTHNGQPIYALKVSDNVATAEDEPAIVLGAQHHAREMNAPHMVIGAMQRILQGYAGDPTLRAVVDGYELYFVPCVNPDGVDHCWNVDQWWRLNRRNNGGSYGVDLNRNYPFLWGLCGASSTPGSSTYKGPSAGSEPESQCMRALAAAVRPEVYLDFHSYGREVLRLYPPCATVSPTIESLELRYVHDLRGPMNYNYRYPSASGEAPHDFWASGAMSFLIEVSTTFQPSWTSTVAEEVRVWPGIRRAVTTWKPAVRGHVRSIFQGQPIEATITYSPNQFSHAETTLSRARDGRYGLWLPIGTWNVTYSAPGFQSRTTSVTVTTHDQPQLIDVELEPVWSAATIAKSGSERVGTTVTLTYTSPGDGGLVFLMGWSLGTSPGIDLGGLRVLPLNDDFLFQAALATNSVLTPTWGMLDPSGQATSYLHIPPSTAFVGLSSYFAGITMDQGYSFLVKKFSQAIGVTAIQ